MNSYIKDVTLHQRQDSVDLYRYKKAQSVKYKKVCNLLSSYYPGNQHLIIQEKSVREKYNTKFSLTLRIFFK